jgi:glycosyltransferase involved in cell wall biosynthesis
VLEYCNRLAERGHTIHLVSLTPDRPDWFPLDSRVVYHTSGWSDRRLAFDLPDADVVIATQWATAYYVARLRAAKGAKFYFIQSYESKTISTPELADPTYLLPLSQIVVSSWLAQELQRRFRTKTVVVPNGIDPGSLYPENSIRQKYSQTDYRIGMLYHPEPRKGFSAGQKFFREIKQRIPEAKLILMGAIRPSDQGAYDEVFENLAPSQVRQFYSTLDVFVCTSQQEGFGLTGLEAMACGIPLVTTDTGGSREYALPMKTAIVCNQGDVTGMVEGVLQLREDADFRQQLISAGLEKAKIFGWEFSVIKLEDVLVQRAVQEEPVRQNSKKMIQPIPGTSTKFYSTPSTAPFLLKIYWRLRDKLSRWKIRARYLLARRFR